MIDRRQLLRSTATGIVGVTAGATLLNQATDEAAASVSMGDLEMSGAQKTTTNGYVEDITATVSGSWQYELPGGEPAQWIVGLRVSDGEAWYSVATTGGNVEYKQYNDTYSVSGSIIETEAFSQETFAAPGPGQQITADLPFQIWFQVQDTNGTPLASTKIEDTATVTIGQESIDASLYGEVAGQGGLSIQ